MAMYDFEIYFFGLIGIYGTSIERNAPAGKTHALLLRDDDHVPVIYLNTTNKDYEIKLTDHVSFDKLPTGESLIVPTFDTYVPHLVRLTRPSVKLYPHPNAPGIKVTLPVGLLAAVEGYSYEGIYILDQTVPYQGCIARLTLLQVTTSYPKIDVRYNSNKKAEVDADGFVFIGNRERYNFELPIPAEPDRFGQRPDFKKYYRITTGNPDDLATLYELEEACDPLIPNPSYIKAKHLDEARAIARVVADHPECSNTQWP